MKESLAPQYVSTRDPKGMKFLSIVQDAYNTAQLTEEEAQRINESRGLSKVIHAFIETHRVARTRHPIHFSTSQSSLKEKIQKLAFGFRLDPKSALQYADRLPDMRTFVPEDALPYTAWYAFPSYDALAVRFFHHENDAPARYCNAVAHMILAISRDTAFILKGKDAVNTSNLRRVHHTHEAVQKLWEVQGRGDIMLAPMQFGKRFGGMSVEHATMQFAKNEHGVCSLMGLSAVFTSRESLGPFSFTMPGDRSHDRGQQFPFDNVPFITCGKNRIIYDHYECDRHNHDMSTATFFMPL